MKTMSLSITRPEEMAMVAKALGSEQRVQILMLLDEGSMNVVELAEQLKMPVSTVSNNVIQLENAGLIHTERQSAVRGSMKLCSRKIDQIMMEVAAGFHHGSRSTYLAMPIGYYSDCEIEPVCGLANREHRIAYEDEPSSFFDVERTTAQILWFRRGFVEYRFSNQALMGRKGKALEVSFEACAEAPNYRNDWPSDITVWINGVELGTWTCPGDFGGRRGKNNPDWWTDASTQYGMLKRWRVDMQGCTLDEMPLSGVKLGALHLLDQPFISLRIGIKKESANQGGINLFGEQFGDYSQAISMRLDYDAE